MHLLLCWPLLVGLLLLGPPPDVGWAAAREDAGITAKMADVSVEAREECMCEACHAINEGMFHRTQKMIGEASHRTALGETKELFLDFRDMLKDVCKDAEAFDGASLPMTAACLDFVAKDGELVIEAWASLGQPGRGFLRNATETVCRVQTNACVRDGLANGARVIPSYKHDFSDCEVCSLVVRDVNRVALRRQLGSATPLSTKARRVAIWDAIETVCTLFPARHAHAFWPSRAEAKAQETCDTLVSDNDDAIVDALAELDVDSPVSAESAVCRRALGVCTARDEL